MSIRTREGKTGCEKKLNLARKGTGHVKNAIGTRMLMA
jgi:hypothetical protein